MAAVEPTHSPAPEDVMAYLDGEVTPASRAAMEAHIAGCGICQAIAAELRGVSMQTKSWTVDAAPATLRTPDPLRQEAADDTDYTDYTDYTEKERKRIGGLREIRGRVPGWTRSRAMLGGLGAAAAVLLVLTFSVQNALKVAPARAVPPPAEARESSAKAYDAVASMSAPPPAAAPAAGNAVVGGAIQSQASLPPVQGGPMVIRTATLRIVVKEFDGVRAAVEAMVTQAGGFIDHLTVSGDSNTARSVTGSLRVPADRMAEVLGRLRPMGQVVEDTQGTQEVTDQIVDLTARLASARATEQRLTDLLKNRTGRLSDVLEVERELTRVRLEIEQLDAQKTNLGRRVTYATIGVTISEERKAGLDAGPLSLSTRIRIAAADGAEAAIETAVGAFLFVLRAGPTLMLWGMVIASGWLLHRSWRHRHPRLGNE